MSRRSDACVAVKATSAAQRRRPTAEEGHGDVLTGLRLTAAAHPQRLTGLPGGVPIVVDGQIAGAIGVSSGTGEQDLQVCHAGIAALTSGKK